MQEVDLCINGLWIFNVKLKFRADRKWIIVYKEMRDTRVSITAIPIDKYYFKFEKVENEDHKNYVVKSKEREEEE